MKKTVEQPGNVRRLKTETETLNPVSGLLYYFVVKSPGLEKAQTKQKGRFDHSMFKIVKRSTELKVVIFGTLQSSPPRNRFKPVLVTHFIHFQ